MRYWFDYQTNYTRRGVPAQPFKRGIFVGATIKAVGKAQPTLVITNDDLATLVETSDEWIVPRTGIHTRRIATTQSTTDLAAAACNAALGIENADDTIETHGWRKEAIDPASIDLIVCMTISGDCTVPSEAALIRARLGLENAVAFDLNAACAGCVYGTSVAENMMFVSHARAGAGNPIRRALVVGAERLTHITNWEDRSTCVLFGDGSGALVLEWSDEEPGIMGTFLKNTDDPDLALVRRNPVRLDPMPFTPVGVDAENTEYSEVNQAALNMPYVEMNGQAVFKFATAALVEAVRVALARAEVDVEDIACIVPHQANERIIRYAAKKLGKPMELFQLSIGDSANTSAASALMALCDAYEAGRINEGDKVVICGFGGGLTSGAIVYQA